MKNKILFISHDAFRAGAQLLFLQLLQWIKINTDIQFEVILKNGGELYFDFEKTGKIFLWNKSNYNKSIFRWYYSYKESYRKKKYKSYLKEQKFDLIYGNTITNGELLHELSFLNIPVITHVHELNYWIEKFGKQNLDYVQEYTTKYIAVSEAVKDNLVVNCNISNDKIELINAFINYDSLISSQKINSLKKHLNISNDSFIIAASGAESWRKGKEMFIPIALHVLKKSKQNIHFVWIGGDLSYELNYDLQKSGFSNNIHFIKHLPNANRFFNDIDIFLMLSRDDPFPIVNLEAGALSKPILCFENTGGTQELIDEFKDLIIPYLDICSMGERILQLIKSKELCLDIGNKLHKKIKNNYDIDIISNKIIKLIYKL